MDEDLVQEVIQAGSKGGASYVDFRAEKGTATVVRAEDGRLKEAVASSTTAAGVKVLTKNGGGWGFSSSVFDGEPPKKKLLELVLRAAKLAKASVGKPPIKLAPTKVARDEVSYPFKRDPEAVSIEEKASLCREATQRMIKVRGIKKAEATILTEKEEKTFASSEGAFISQRRVYCSAGADAIAVANGNKEWYHKFDGGYQGYELISRFDLPNTAEAAARTALAFARAKPAPTKKVPVILDPWFAGLLTHEVIGHPSEADRVLGREAAWAGRTWWADKVGKKLFSPLLTVVSDATLGQGYLGSFKYDDEGTPTKRVVHIQNGVLKEFLNNRETAAILGAEPNGGARAVSPLVLPLIRMTNTFIERGTWTLDEMLDGIKYGVYLKGDKMPSVDSRRFNFQIAAWEAYEIVNGKLGAPLRGASLRANTQEFLSSIDAIGRDLKIIAIPNCGKGDPMQTMRVGNGAPHIRGYGVVTGPK